MAQTFNSPPGWPTPPEGWTPPPGWSPDPSWPQAPEGWQFWTADPFVTALDATRQGSEPPSSTSPSQPSSTQPSSTQPSQQPDSQSTQTMGTTPTQVIPPSSEQPVLYTYAPSAGLEQPGASPYEAPSAPQGGYNPGPGGYGGGAYAGGQYTSPGGPAPKSRNPVAIVAVVVVVVLVLGGVAWGLTSVLSGGDEDPTGVGDPTTTDVTSTADPTGDPTTDAPTDDPTTDDPTDPATTDDGGGGSTTGAVDLTGSDPAMVNGTSGEPVVEVRLVEAVLDWESSTPSSLCSPAENGQYLGLQLEFTTLPALANEETPTYTFIGWELGAEVDGIAIETNGFSSGLFCLGTGERPPSDMQPGQTYTGWAVLDVPDSVTAVTFEDMFDFSGAEMYRWVLADQ